MEVSFNTNPGISKAFGLHDPPALTVTVVTPAISQVKDHLSLLKSLPFMWYVPYRDVL